MYRAGQWIKKGELDEKLIPAGHEWQAGRITRKRATTRPSELAPEVWKSLDKKGRDEAIAKYGGAKAEGSEGKPTPSAIGAEFETNAVPAMPLSDDPQEHREREQTIALGEIGLW